MKLVATLPIFLGLLLSKTITVSGVQCWVCTWIDSDNEEWKKGTNHTDECKTLDDTSKADLTPLGRSINSKYDDANIPDPAASSSPSMAAQISGHKARGRVGEPAEICFRIVGKSRGTPFIARGGINGDQVRNKGNGCDDGDIADVKILGSVPDQMRACWCNTDKCNTDKELEKLGLSDKEPEGNRKKGKPGGGSAVLATRETFFKINVLLLAFTKLLFN